MPIMQIYRLFRRFNFIVMLPIQAIKIFMIMALLLLLNSNSLDEGLFFQISSPSKLAFIYQINPSYHICTRFPSYPIKEIALVYADPPEGCSPFENANFVSGEVVLLERGGCPFVEKVLNAQNAGAKFAIVTDSSSASDDFIDMVTDDTKRRANIPCAWLPGISGRNIRNYLLYEEPVIYIDIPLNYTNRSLKDTYGQKPPWYKQ